MEPSEVVEAEAMYTKGKKRVYRTQKPCTKVTFGMYIKGFGGVRFALLAPR